MRTTTEKSHGSWRQGTGIEERIERFDIDNKIVQLQYVVPKYRIAFDALGVTERYYTKVYPKSVWCTTMLCNRPIGRRQVLVGGTSSAVEGTRFERRISPAKHEGTALDSMENRCFAGKSSKRNDVIPVARVKWTVGNALLRGKGGRTMETKICE